MKIKFLVFAAMIAICALSCKKGKQGPEGPKGEQGVPGAGAKTWTYNYTAQDIQPTINEGYDEGSALHTLSGKKTFTPERYKEVLDKGIVLVYFRTSPNGSWHLGSLSDSRTENGNIKSYVDYQPVLAKDYIEITGRTRSASEEAGYLKGYKFDVKVVLIEGSVN